jgi:hypothetical protein
MGEVHGGLVDPGSIFDLILYATDRRPHAPSGPRSYIAWTAGDRTALFGKIRGWWDAHGRSAVTRPPRRSLFGDTDRGTIAAFMRGAWNVVREVVLPVTPRRSRLGADILRFVEDVRASGLPVGSVLPATLFVRPEVDAVASALRREFAHAGLEFYLSALLGLDHWASLTDRRRRLRTGIPAIPLDLLREVGTAVATRRLGVTRLALQCAGSILKRFGRAADQRFRDSLLIGLEYLFTEAAYSERLGESAAIQYEEVPSIRREAAGLAKYLSILGHDAHPAVRQWLEAAGTDPLPEVRRAVAITLDSNLDD